MIGSLARFECIVQSDPPVSIVWKKDDEVLRDTDLLQINFRNGVCKLTLLKTYKCTFHVALPFLFFLFFLIIFINFCS